MNSKAFFYLFVTTQKKKKSLIFLTYAFLVFTSREKMD